MSIRKYQERDKQALVSLWQTVFPDDPPHNKPSQVLAAKLAVDDLIYIAEEDGDIVGACMVGYDGHRGWLYAVAVSPTQRRKGTGKALVEHAMKALKDTTYKGFVSIFMHPYPRGIPILPASGEATAEINRARRYLEALGGG